MKIAILGAPGSFTEEAARIYCQQRNISSHLVRRESSNGVFSAVEKQKASLGIVPIANSVGGIVVETLSSMSKHKFSPLSLLELPIVQNLLIMPGISLDQIDKIVSHPQAFAQCRLYLARNWLRVKKVNYSSTAKAAKDLSLGKLNKYTAVIGSEEAARLYGLHITAPNIQDSRFNFTQFLVFDRNSKYGLLKSKENQSHQTELEPV